MTQHTSCFRVIFVASWLEIWIKHHAIALATGWSLTLRQFISVCNVENGRISFHSTKAFSNLYMNREPTEEENEKKPFRFQRIQFGMQWNFEQFNENGTIKAKINKIWFASTTRRLKSLWSLVNLYRTHIPAKTNTHKIDYNQTGNHFVVMAMTYDK